MREILVDVFLILNCQKGFYFLFCKLTQPNVIFPSTWLKKFVEDSNIDQSGIESGIVHNPPHRYLILREELCHVFFVYMIARDLTNHLADTAQRRFLLFEGQWIGHRFCGTRHMRYSPLGIGVDPSDGNTA